MNVSVVVVVLWRSGSGVVGGFVSYFVLLRELSDFGLSGFGLLECRFAVG